MTPPKSQLAFQLKTLFMGSDGTIPESYARTVDKKQLGAWIKEGLIAHRPAVIPRGQAAICYFLVE
jgi:hypothetical protein